MTTLFDYRTFRAWSVVAYGIALVLLALVLVAGTEVNGAQAWFRIGPLQFQPAEFAKISIVLVLAAHFHEYREEALGMRALIEALAFALFPMMLILLQPDFGTFIVFAVIVAGILLMAGVHVRYLLALVGGARPGQRRGAAARDREGVPAGPADGVPGPREHRPAGCGLQRGAGPDRGRIRAVPRAGDRQRVTDAVPLRPREPDRLHLHRRG